MRAARVLPASLRARLGEVRDRRRSIQGHRELYGAAKRIDVEPVEAIRRASLDVLRDPVALERLLPELGLNDEWLEQFPDELHPYAGAGLLHWQYPAQFSRYLVELSRRGVHRYVEIGTRHGGTFVITVEYLRRFGVVDWALGIDIQRAPGLEEYARTTEGVVAKVMDSRGGRFRSLVAAHAPIDLVLIDGDHSEEGVREDLAGVAEHARMIAFHDIVSDLVPGVGRVWREIRDERAEEWKCLEFVDQYPGVVQRFGHPLLGLGLAVRRQAGH